jgi:hypothetical protein
VCAMARRQLNILESDWEALEAGQGEIVRSLVKDVSYNGATGAVSLRTANANYSSSFSTINLLLRSR